MTVMIDDLKAEVQKMAAEERRLLSVKSRLRGWTIALIILIMAALALVYVAIHPNLLPGTIGENLARLLGKDAGAGTSAAYLGVEIQDLKASVADAMDLKYDGGVTVTRVIPSSPAARAGLQPGDIILRFEGSRVGTTAELQKLLAGTRPGDVVRIVLDRAGQSRTFYVELGQRPSNVIQTAFGPPAQTDPNAGQTAPGAEWGCTLSPLTPDLMQKLSVPSSIRGVVVVAVASSGLAKTAGILPGDVIISVNRQATPDLALFYRTIKDQQSLVLGIYRGGQTLYLQLQAGSAPPPLATIAGSLNETTPLPSRVAVAATGNDLNAQVAARFGTAPYFIIGDMATNRFWAVPNSALSDARGYGIAAAQLVAAQGAQSAVSVSYGPQAYDALKALNVIPLIAQPAKVSDVLNQYRSGLLTQVTEPTISGYGYARTIIPTGGSPFSSDDTAEEEEQSGYKGLPYTIPPKGQYDPALDPANALQKTVGSTQRTDYCYCPSCQILVPHPASIPCAQLTCPQCGNRLMNLDSGSLAPGSNLPAATTSQTLLPNQNQLRVATAGSSTQTGTLPGSAGALNLNQQTEFCYCPFDNIVYEHPAGIPCSSLLCTICGSRLISLGSGSRSSQVLPSAGVTVGGQPATIPPMGQTSAGVTVAGPTTIPPMGQTSTSAGAGGQVMTIPGGQQQSAGSAVRPSAGVTVGGQPSTIPPMGQTTVGITVGGQPATIPPMGQTSAGVTVAGPTTIPPMGQTSTSAGAGGQAMTIPGGQQQSAGSAVRPSAGVTVGGQPATIPPMGQTTAATDLSTGVLQGTVDGNCVCPKCGTTVPHLRGTACYTIPCPRCGTLMVREGAVISRLSTYPTALPSAGVTVGGQPATIPPMGQTTVGITVGGQPATIPPMGQTSAGVTSADTTTIPPPGQISPLGVSPLLSALPVAGDTSGSICVAASGPTMDAQVAPLFGRAPYFLIVGLGTFRAIPNPNATDKTGVGVQSAQLVVSEGARVVITNDLGVTTLEELTRLRVQVFTGVNGTARQAVEWYQDGRLTPASLSTSSTEEEHGQSSSKAKAKGESTSRSL